MAVRDALRDASVSLGLHDGELWLRSVFANPQADVGLLVDEVRRASAQVGGSTAARVV